MPCGLTSGSWLLDVGRSPAVSTYAIYCSIRRIWQWSPSNKDVFDFVVFVWLAIVDTKRWHSADYCVQTYYSCKGPLLSTHSAVFLVN